tara:strand:+ start:287 stop:466 length:180 start_codon:yes stop_codon:yes gene_type:complete
MNIPKRIAAINDIRGEFLRENGNNQRTGQHGEIPLIFSHSGEVIVRAGKQNAVKKIKSF